MKNYTLLNKSIERIAKAEHAYNSMLGVSMDSVKKEKFLDEKTKMDFKFIRNMYETGNKGHKDTSFNIYFMDYAKKLNGAVKLWERQIKCKLI
jgi:hypothetical protein